MAERILSVIKSGEYFDSVTLMVVAKKVKELDGVSDAALLMATEENKKILKMSGLFQSSFESANDNELMIALKAEESILEATYKKLEDFLKEIKNKKGKKTEAIYFSQDQALKDLPDANLAVISVAGKYAYAEARKSLENGLNVLLFSDNVSLEKEIELKKYASKHDLIVMGPDCGTAIISGTPLAFANGMNPGDIGVVGASGTGTQEVTSLITNLGGGISHAIGTGGRDIKKEVGGISFLKGLELLKNDDNTKVILLVSKPPHEDVLKKIGEAAKETDKKIIACFLGANRELVENNNMQFAESLEKGALLALKMSLGKEVGPGHSNIKEIASELSKNLKPKQKYIRALYSGGTFSLETQLILEKELIKEVYSNSPVKSANRLDDSHISQKHSIIDLGEDEFTQGRPHPMIDYTLRNERILKEIKDPEVACLLIDLVLGYGSNKNPMDEFIPTIKKARAYIKREKKELPIICTVTGTKFDPQEKKKLITELVKLNVIVPFSNAQGAYLCSNIARNSLGGKHV